MSKKSKRFPWNVLGIAPTRDRLAIKKAYAAKLKVTRPEDDADAFQELVRARDRALAWAEDEQRVEVNTKDSVRRKKRRTTEEITKLEATESCDATSDGERHDEERDADADETEDQSRSRVIVDCLTRCFTPDGDRPEWAELEHALSDIAELNLEERRHVEYQLVYALQDNMEFVRAENRRQSAIGDEQRWVVSILDEEFGWTQNDQRLSAMVFFQDMDFVDDLRNIIAGKGVQDRAMAVVHPHAWWQSWWVWLLLLWALLQIARAVNG